MRTGPHFAERPHCGRLLACHSTALPHGTCCASGPRTSTCASTRSPSRRAHARRLGTDEDAFGIVGLVHDFDYERNPTAETHVYAGARVLRDQGWPETWVRAIEGHADYTGVPRNTPWNARVVGPSSGSANSLTLDTQPSSISS